MVFLIALLVGIVSTLLVIRWSKSSDSAADSQLAGPQKFHVKPVPRIGGVAVFTAIAAVVGYVSFQNDHDKHIFLVLFLCSLPAFFIGLLEDFTKQVSPTWRLLVCAAGALIACIVLNASIVSVEFRAIDYLLSFSFVSVIFTIFAVAGLCNAINIIDGFNGLAGFVSAMMFLSVAYVAYQVGDTFIMTVAFAMAGAILGFLVWNYPLGLIFLGDGGAYFIGFMLAETVILLTTRNPEVSAWYAVLLLSYPIIETMFSIYRKKFIRGMSPSMPDGVHLHMLVFRRVIRWAVGNKSAAHITMKNSTTSPYLWLLSGIAILPASVSWSVTPLLVGLFLLFTLIYLWIYFRIVRFKTPRWLIFKKSKNNSASLLSNQRLMRSESNIKE